MKAPDPCERWELRSPEEIIERLIAKANRTVGVPVTAPTARPARDAYYTMARRCHVKHLMRGKQ